ncbi:MAG: hypothetical protein JWN94_4961 [Betaproteobacteria bacterium]|nr:hypothetical protein [Betaproteobacteria bacterium]
MKRKFTLRFDQTKSSWVLRHDDSERILRTFKSKEEGSRAGILRKTLGKTGGIVVLRTKTGVFDEERVFPELRA